MTITFKWSDGVVYEFKVSEDYGAVTMYSLWDALMKNPRLGKKMNHHYEFGVKDNGKEDK